MGTLMADYLEMNKAVTGMEKIIRGVTDAVDMLEEGVLRLDITWAGDANTEFMLSMLKDIEDIRKITDEMVCSKDLLRKALVEYQTGEAKIKERIREVRI
ncbi:MAG: hypothetical protein K5886_09465 [Lachnospiraceae bacterium]|nr:hypothetical protein [Lachnospiraceae bacterium]